MRRILMLGALTALVVACGDLGVTDPKAPTGPSRIIQDANHNQGNNAFFWLPPVIKNPVYSGVFNPHLKPKVVICATVDGVDAEGNAIKVCGGTLAEYTTTTGTDGNTIAVSTTDQHYKVNWQTKNFTLDQTTTYRIQVFLTAVEGSERLGFADVVFADNMQAAKNLATDEEIALVDGSTLPVIFRIEEGVSCNDPTADCGEGVVGTSGGTVTTSTGYAGVEVPPGALDGDLLITIRRVDPATQPWQDCLPTGLRQEEGCYDFDTEPAIGAVNPEDRFRDPVTVGVCLDPMATRPENLTLHKYDPEYPANGVVELAGAPASFLTCEGFAFEAGDGLFARFASAARRLLTPVAVLVGGKPLYATDTGRGGTTDAFSFIGWAEPVEVSLTAAPDFEAPGATITPVIKLKTAHYHAPDTAMDASGATLRFEYTDPEGKTTVLPPIVTDASGQATPTWTLTSALGAHVLTVSTRKKIELGADSAVIRDPTPLFTVDVGAYATAHTACEGSTDCGQAVVGPEGDTVTSAAGYAGVAIPAGAVNHEILVTIRRIVPDSQAWGACLPTQLRQEEGCYEFDTEPALHLVNDGADRFNTNVTVGVCLDPDALRPGNLTLHKYDPEYPGRGVEELAGASVTFLTCESFAMQEPSGVLGRFAAAARDLVRPVTSVFVPRLLYATDTGRGGTTDAFSFFGWAEPATLSLASSPATVASEGDTLTVDISGITAHVHADSAPHPASGTGLLAEWLRPDLTTTAWPVDSLDNLGAAQLKWDLTGAADGTHVLKITTRRVAGRHVILDPTDSVAFSIDVVSCTICSVAVSPSTSDLLVGETEQLTATALDAAGKPVIAKFTWTSSNTSVATVDGSGLVTAVALGTATITATETATGTTGTAEVTVRSGTVFFATFEKDAVGEAPGAPEVGTWSLISNDVKVQSGLGQLGGNVVVLTHPGGSAISPSLQGTLAGAAPTSGVYVARWRYVSNTDPGTSLSDVFGPIVFRGSGGIIAAVEFRGDANADGTGEITFNNATTRVGSWTRNIPQTFELTIDLDNKVTTLVIDGAVVATGAAFVQAATSLNVIGVEVGLTVPQQFGWDDVQIERASR